MSISLKTPKAMMLVALMAGAAPATLYAQDQMMTPPAGSDITVDGVMPMPTAEELAALPDGPEVEGTITMRRGDAVQVTGADGAASQVMVVDTTRVTGSGGFLGLGRSKLATDSLMNGLPITAKTKQWNGTLIASQVKLANKDLKVASMIRAGTAQGFAEQTAATEALRGRVADIDQYNVKATTNVNFDTGQAVLTEDAKAALCSTAQSAETMDNALLLVVGYTDSTGDEEFNQMLSEKRAAKVVNYLQQACSWKPYRMLTPTGMAEADPLADNMTEEGKAQNRRVAVNILVSKGLDGIQSAGR
ncbi:OmpA family protein [Sphingomonas sp. CJ99]